MLTNRFDGIGMTSAAHARAHGRAPARAGHPRRGRAGGDARGAAAHLRRRGAGASAPTRTRALPIGIGQTISQPYGRRAHDRAAAAAAAAGGARQRARDRHRLRLPDGGARAARASDVYTIERLRPLVRQGARATCATLSVRQRAPEARRRPAGHRRGAAPYDAIVAPPAATHVPARAAGAARSRAAAWSLPLRARGRAACSG
ncbi:MAG: hypothetical protein MZW92_70505 [Comamonadaceae bacterium]|nr:hypothetical protein [Comamonadaceae bacterium]